LDLVARFSLEFKKPANLCHLAWQAHELFSFTVVLLQKILQANSYASTSKQTLFPNASDLRRVRVSPGIKSIQCFS